MSAAACGFSTNISGNVCRGYLTTANVSPWTVPSDWNPSKNTVELIGAGGGGNGGTTVTGGGWPGAAGGGGGYTKLSNGGVSGTVVFKVGTGGGRSIGK